jgi:hypothetical protein
MGTRNQFYFLQADWPKLKAFIAAKIANTADVLFPYGIAIDHLYFEDLRKIIWMLEHQDAGNYDDSALDWNNVALPAYTEQNPIYKYAGDWEVTTFDTSHGLGTYDPATQSWSGRWLRWRNTRDLYNHDVYITKAPPFSGPPTNIHTADNVWVTSNANWELAPSPNYYHDWDVNFPGKAHYIDIVTYEGVEIARDERYCPASKFYPKQTDPKEQLQNAIYTDTQLKDYRFGAKVAFDHYAISNPGAMGAVFSAWNRWAWDSIAEAVFQKRWGYGNYGGVFYGNQYANTRNQPQDNAPSVDGVDWTLNSKCGDALQPKIELILSYGGFRLLADATYEANFKIFNSWAERESPLSPSDAVDTDPSWNQYPNVEDELWGENESGFELLLKKRGSYDWYFDTAFPYIPSQFGYWAAKTEHGQNGGSPPDFGLPEGSSWKKEWGCTSDAANPLIGTWRRTWHNSLGRVSPFMRSGGMGEPTHRKDTWAHATRIPTYGVADDRWYGARTNQMPILSDFDNQDASITKISDYEFTVSGDKTADLKIGWMIHLCDTTDAALEYVLPAYALSVQYDGTNTKIVCSELIGDYTKICWNKEISQRHDGINASWKIIAGVMSYKIYYYPTAELMLEMKELLETINVADAYVLTDYRWITGEENEGAPGMVTALVSFSDEDLTSGYDRYGDDGVGGAWSAHCTFSSYLSRIYTEVILKQYLYDGAWVWGDAPLGKWYQAFAMKMQWFVTGTLTEDQEEKVLAACPKTILVPFAIPEIIEGQPGGPQRFSQYASSGGITITNYLVPAPGTGKVHYVYGPMEVNGKWYVFAPQNLFPSLKLYFEEPYIAKSEVGSAEIYFSVNTARRYAVVLDWDLTPESVWERSFLGHRVAPVTPKKDTKPPRPDPPVFHLNPQAIFTYVPKVGTYGEEGYEPPRFELGTSADIVLCEDLEGSDPVKYQTVCNEDEDLSSSWLSVRATYKKEEDIAIETFNLTGLHRNYVAADEKKLFHDGEASDFEADDIVQLALTPDVDGIYTVLSSGSLTSSGDWTASAYDAGTIVKYTDDKYYIAIDDALSSDEPTIATTIWKETGIGAYVVLLSSIITAGAADITGIIINLTRIYTPADWTAETPYNTYTFSPRAKDSASPTENLTKLGEPVLIEAPTADEYPVNIAVDMGGIEFS